jgi:hypothetical protein
VLVELLDEGEGLRPLRGRMSRVGESLIHVDLDRLAVRRRTVFLQLAIDRDELFL